MSSSYVLPDKITSLNLGRTVGEHPASKLNRIFSSFLFNPRKEVAVSFWVVADGVSLEVTVTKIERTRQGSLMHLGLTGKVRTTSGQKVEVYIDYNALNSQGQLLLI